MPSIHALARRMHGGAAQAPETALETRPRATEATGGLVLNSGAGYDLMIAAADVLLFRGALRALRRRTVDLAHLKSGEVALDVGCGTGALAVEVARRVSPTGRVVGVDPGPAQIARARANGVRRGLPATFQVGVVERLEFPDQTFDVVFSTLMMHHLPANLKRQGLAEIARALKPGGRLVIADFIPKTARRGRAAHFHAGGSDMAALAALAAEAGFSQVNIEEARQPRFSLFPGAGLLTARKA
ncbi:MAG TPA: class I SAM-dependent methyltransferase [Ktedonobacterales bacterium]